jgi:RecB family endonuclease NucS
MKKNIYTHGIELTNLQIKNRPREEFRRLLEKVKYRGYEVEQLTDGKKIVITKPGGKFVFGKVKREDFMVWVYNPNDSSLWLISHKDIYNDLEKKGEINPSETVKIIDALERVFDGEEPDNVLQGTELNRLTGEPPEVLLRAYKWIWGQEDCNYPEGEGREMSMKGLRELRQRLRENHG